MSLTTEDMLVGASILSLIDSLDELSENISYRFSRGEKKSCYLLSIQDRIKNKNLQIGLYIKRSRISDPTIIFQLSKIGLIE